jgi:prepilin-type processing-associated H-X9-DG protein
MPLRRAGVSLIETLLALAIVGLMVGLLLSAVQKVRGVAERTGSTNNLRQIMLAVQQSSGNTGRLPGWKAGAKSSLPDRSPLADVMLLLYPEYRGRNRQHQVDEDGIDTPKLFRNPSDPSYAFHPPSQGTSPGNTSYGANFLVFSGHRALASEFPDGLSNTIAFTEHYARCGPAPPANFSVSLRLSILRKNGVESYNPERRRCSFADRYYDNVIPLTEGRVTRPSRPGVTFQTAPTVPKCDPTIPQTPHNGGMVTAMLDGSVRITKSGVSPEVFWSAVTPAGRETVPFD